MIPRPATLKTSSSITGLKGRMRDGFFGDSRFQGLGVNVIGINDYFNAENKLIQKFPENASWLSVSM